MPSSQAYEKAVRFIESLPVPRDWNLARMQKLVRRANINYSKLRFIHVTGSNGKGSACAFTASILSHAGFKVGLYTSPHLVDWRERFAINGKRISERDFARLLGKIKPHALAVGASQFEILTALALAWFAEEKPDWIAWEVGLGGRLDATNIVNAGFAIITSISLEHTDRLGTTLRKIAWEKSKVIKRGAVVITPNASIALKTIAGECKAQHARLVRVPSPTGVSCTASGTRFNFGGRPWAANLLGFHQAVNASVAIAFAREIGIPDGIIAVGLRKADWPGRMQVYSRNPLVVIDGAHNPGGINALSVSFAKIFGAKPVLVVGIMKDKDWRKMTRSLAVKLKPRVAIATAPNNERSLDARVLAERFSELGVNSVAVESVANAVSVARKLAAEEGAPVLVTGSLYTIGELLASKEKKQGKRLNGLLISV